MHTCPLGITTKRLLSHWMLSIHLSMIRAICKSLHPVQSISSSFRNKYQSDLRLLLKTLTTIMVIVFVEVMGPGNLQGLKYYTDSAILSLNIYENCHNKKSSDVTENKFHLNLLRICIFRNTLFSFNISEILFQNTTEILLDIRFIRDKSNPRLIQCDYFGMRCGRKMCPNLSN